MSEIVITEQLLESTKQQIEEDMQSYADEVMSGDWAQYREVGFETAEKVREKMMWGRAPGYFGNLSGNLPGGFLRRWAGENEELLSSKASSPHSSDLRKSKTAKEFWDDIDAAITASGQSIDHIVSLMGTIKQILTTVEETGIEDPKRIEMDIELAKYFFSPYVRLIAQQYNRYDFTL